MNELKKDIFSLLLEGIEKSLFLENYLSVLILVLTIPDICASIDSGKNSTDGQNEALYKKWLNEYTCYKDDGNMLSSYVVYKTRCRLLHNGRFQNGKMDKIDFSIYFVMPSNVRITSRNGSVPINVAGKQYLQVNIDEFVKNILDGITLWKQKVSESENYLNYIKDAVKFGLPNLGGGYTSNLPTLQ